MVPSSGGSQEVKGPERCHAHDPAPDQVSASKQRRDEPSKNAAVPRLAIYQGHHQVITTEEETGSVEAIFPKENVRMQGPVKTYEQPSDESGYLITTQLGGTVGMTFERFPDVQAIMMGTLDDPNWPKVQKHLFTRSFFHWLQFRSGVDLFEAHSSPARKPGFKPGQQLD